MLEHALAYQKLGWHIVPISPAKKHPRIKWKPFQIKIPTTQQITNWFTKWPDSNIGAITGPESGICSLDIDSPEATETIRHRFDLPDTIIQETGRGRQYIFKYPEDDIKSQAGLIKHVDFKGKNGIIVLPPSTHSSGKQYKWLHIDPLEDGLDDLLDLPDDIKAWIYNGGAPESSQDQRSHEKVGTRSPQGQSMGEKDPDWLNNALLHGVSKGKRDDICFKMACKMVGEDRPKDQILQVLLVWNKSNRPPLDNDIIKEKCQSAEKYRGKSKFSEMVEKKISNFTQVISKTGDHYYRMTIDNISFTVQPTQLYNQRQYAVQLMSHTGVVMDLIKGPAWNEYIRSLIKDREIEYEREDSTPIDFIRTRICADIDNMQGHEYSAKAAFVLERPILDKGWLILRVAHVQEAVKFEQGPMSARKVTDFLKIMGFEPCQYGDSKKRIRAWRMDYKQFKSGGS